MCADGVQMGHFSAAIGAWYGPNKTWRAVTHWCEIPFGPRPAPKVTGEAKVERRTAVPLFPYWIVEIKNHGYQVMTKHKTRPEAIIAMDKLSTSLSLAVISIADLKIEY